MAGYPPTGAKPPTHWTVRSPYRTLVTEDDDTGISSQSGSSTGDMEDRIRSLDISTLPKSMRTTRPTPAYLPNFVHTGPEHASGTLHGETKRLYNNRNPTYYFPCDERENTRQDHQHTAFSILFNGLYPCPEAVRATLRHDTGTPKSILDLGCGTGTWAIAMALEFPNATVLGVDLAPCPAHPSEIPANCRFEIDDINDGLEHFNQGFDIVHVRGISMGIRNYRKTRDEVSKCLKPGGLAIFIDGDLELLGRDTVTVLPMAMGSEEVLRKDGEGGEGGSREDARVKSLWTEGSWLQRLVFELKHAAQLGGSDLSGSADAIDEGLWRMSLFDTETCGGSSVFVPIGSWVKTRDVEKSNLIKYVGALMRVSMRNMIRASTSLFLQRGVSQSVVDQWISSVDHELNTDKFDSFLRLRVAWGRRKYTPVVFRLMSDSTPDRQPPILAAAPTTTTPSAAEAVEQSRLATYVAMEVYTTQAEALNAREARRRTRPLQPVPIVSQVANGASHSVSS